MAEHRFSRMQLLVGADGMDKLQRASVAVFGIGGVGPGWGRQTDPGRFR